MQSGVPFYVKYHLGEGGASSTILLGTVIVMAIDFYSCLGADRQKDDAYAGLEAGVLVSSISVIPLYFTNTLILSAIAVVAVGFGMGGVSTTMDIVAARILDEDAAKHGVQREGTYSSLLGILNKSSGLFSSLAYLLVFRFYGFESGRKSRRGAGSGRPVS